MIARPDDEPGRESLRAGISVIVCTVRPSESLRRTIRSLLIQTQPVGRFEIIVVDNGSEAGVEAAIDELAGGAAVPIRYLRHEDPGLSGARNVGVRASEGQVIAFIDDDAVADMGWLVSFCDTFERVPDADVIGGPVEPLGQPELPGWIHPRVRSYLSVVDHGRQDKTLHFPHYPIGTNMALKRSVFERVGFFDPLLGGQDAVSLATGDETDLFLRVETAGGRILYTPGPVVYHEIHPDRLQLCWFLERARGIGWSFAIMEKKAKPPWRVWWQTLLSCVQLIAATLLWVGARLFGREDWVVYSRCVLAHSRGYIGAALRMAY